MQKAEDFAYKHADKVVSLLPYVDNYMQLRKMDVNKFVYIPNGICIEDWQEEKLISLTENIRDRIKKIRKDFRFIIGYAGGMGESNALEYLIDAAIFSPEIAFVLVGDGVNKLKLEKKAESAENNNIFFLGHIPKGMVAEFLTRMDVLYIGWNNIPIYRFGVSPNKLFDYMMAKKPILHSISIGNDLVKEAQCGISVPAANVEAIGDALERFRQMHPDELARLGKNGYDYVIGNHDYKKLAKNFLEVCG